MTKSSKVDYDPIAATYSQRYQANRLPGVGQALLSLAERTHARRVLEAGCGTGRWLAELKQHGLTATGLDLSAGMLEQARLAGALDLARGRAEQLPFQHKTFDLVFSVNALHHFSSPQAFIESAYRCLRPGGALAVIGMDPHRRQDRWAVYDYFEGTLELDLQRFPSSGAILDWMALAGFREMEWRLAEHIHGPMVGEEVLESHFMQKHGTSQLVLLSDEAYQEGMKKINLALSEAAKNGKELVFRSDIDLAMIIGWV